MESTLAITFDELRQRIAFERGFETDSSEWSTAQLERINFAVRDGLRIAYGAFDWSFLKPTITFTLPTGTSEVTLPDDFERLIGDIYYADAEIGYYAPLRVENDGKVRLAQQKNPTVTGVPLVAAIRAGTNPGGASGQRQELIYWPTTDQAYSVQFQYSVLPDVLSASRPYPYGGAGFSQCLLMACLAASEATVNGQPGPYTGMYQMELRKAIDMDRKRGPEVIGHQTRYITTDTVIATYNGSHS